MAAGLDLAALPPSLLGDPRIDSCDGVFMQQMRINLNGLLLSLVLFTGCLPRPKTEVHEVSASLIVQGRIETSQGIPAARARIYLEQQLEPEALSDDSGYFSFLWSADRLADLRLRYGLQKGNVRLYFESIDWQKESNVLSSLTLLDRDVHNLGVIRLAREAPVRGKVIAQVAGSDVLAPIEGALVRLGRHAILTDAKGEFVSSAPKEQNLPIIIEKSDFVQSQAIWAMTEATESREFRLFSALKPIGTLERLPREQTFLEASSVFVFTATNFAKWLRVSTNEGDLKSSRNNPLAPWRALDSNLNLSLTRASGAVIFYQFADEQQQILSPIQSTNF